MRSILVQGLPLLDQELTESSIVQVFSAYGEISKLLLQTNEESKSQRAVLVFAEAQGAHAALQANGRDILGSNCSVGLASSMPPLHEGLGRENVSDQPDVGGQSENRKMTYGEWVAGFLAQGMVYTRLFDEKLGVSQTAKVLAGKVQKFDETHKVSGTVTAAAMTAAEKARIVDNRLKVSETAFKWAQKTKESTGRAIESNPRVAAGVKQAGDAFTKVVTDVSEFAQLSLRGLEPPQQPQQQGRAQEGSQPANSPDGSFKMAPGKSIP